MWLTFDEWLGCKTEAHCGLALFLAILATALSLSNSADGLYNKVSAFDNAHGSLYSSSTPTQAVAIKGAHLWTANCAHRLSFYLDNLTLYERKLNHAAHERMSTLPDT